MYKYKYIYTRIYIERERDGRNLIKGDEMITNDLYMLMYIHIFIYIHIYI